MPDGKPFLTYDEQIALLRKKHLIISDEIKARVQLSETGYFALLGGYKDHFKSKENKRVYREGITFEQIVKLYEFDEKLRHLFFWNLLSVERTIKTRTAYAFCEKHQEIQEAYLIPQSYDYPEKKKEIDRLVEKLDHLVHHDDYPYIVHHRESYGHVPLWVLMNVLTFGTVSRMFSCLPQNIQSQVTRNYDPLQITQLSQLLKVLTHFRNACAHNERFFLLKSPKADIPDLSHHGRLEIPKKGDTYAYGKRDLFAVVIALRCMLSVDRFRVFQDQLEHEIDGYLQDSGALTSEQLYEGMGFPPCWRKIKEN